TTVPKGKAFLQEALDDGDHSIATAYHLYYGREKPSHYKVTDEKGRNVPLQTIMSVGLWFRQTDLAGIHSYDYPEMKLVSGGVEHQSIVGRHQQADKCRHQLGQIIGMLNEGLHLMNSSYLEAVIYFDSFGHRESGTTRGRLVWLGDYFSCTRLQVQLDVNSTLKQLGTNEKTSMRYCLANLRERSWKAVAGFSAEKYASLKTAVCLPRSCDSLASEQNIHLISELIRRVTNEPLVESLIVESIYCLPDEESPLRQWNRDPVALSLVIFLTIWFMITFVCSVIDTLDDAELVSDYVTNSSGSSFRTVVTWFSIGRHLQHLMSVNPNKANGLHRVTLEPLEGLKAIFMLLIVVCHVYILQGITHLTLDFIGVYEELHGWMLVIGGGLSVNVFLTITGLVTTYLMFKTVPMKRMLNPATWITMAIFRYLRIVPTWLIMVWIAKSFNYVGSGPMWDYGTSNTTNAHVCQTRNTWTSVLLATASTEPLLERCLATDWYLSLDLLFAATIAPLYIVALAKWPSRITYSLARISAFVGVMVAYHKMASTSLDLATLGKTTIATLYSFVILYLGDEVFYASPIVRVPCFILGCVFGHMLYEYECHHRSAHQTPVSFGARLAHQLCQIPSYIALPSAILCLCSSPIIFWLLRRAPFTLGVNTIVAIRFSLLYGSYFPAAVLTLPPLLSYKYPRAARFLSHPVWKVLSRMGLEVLLVHVLVILYYFSSLTQILNISHDLTKPNANNGASMASRLMSMIQQRGLESFKVSSEARRQLDQAIAEAESLIADYERNGIQDNLSGLPNFLGSDKVRGLPKMLMDAEVSMMRHGIEMAKKMIDNPWTGTMDLSKDITNMMNHLTRATPSSPNQMSMPNISGLDGSSNKASLPSM
ncbi:Nose resistant to fluoxetine protein 6, partial [Fragariocoptes setiger]